MITRPFPITSALLALVIVACVIAGRLDNDALYGLVLLLARSPIAANNQHDPGA